MKRSEEKLLAGARRLEEQALAAMYDQYSNALYTYALRLLGDEQSAEDVVAETFYRLLRAFSAGGGPRQHVRAYLYRIAHNLVMDQFRRAPPEATGIRIEDLQLRSNDPGPEAEAIHQWEQVRARRLLWMLTEDQRQVIVLKFFEGLSNSEIAESVEKPIGAVKSLQHRALRSLQRILQQQDEGEKHA